MSPARQDIEPLTRREQIRDAAIYLAVIVVGFPIFLVPLFWLRWNAPIWSSF